MLVNNVTAYKKSKNTASTLYKKNKTAFLWNCGASEVYLVFQDISDGFWDKHF